MITVIMTMGIMIAIFLVLAGLAVEIGRASAENVAKARKEAEERIASIRKK